MLLEATNRVAFDVCETTKEGMSIDVDGDVFGFAFFRGPSFGTVLGQFTAFTCRSPLSPKWSFGVSMSRAGYETRMVVEEIASRLRGEEIPCDALHFDTQWMGLDSPATLEWDRVQLPEPESMIASLYGHVDLLS